MCCSVLLSLRISGAEHLSDAWHATASTAIDFVGIPIMVPYASSHGYHMNSYIPLMIQIYG